MSLSRGDRIGDYEILGVLGVGGMGEVYKVRNTITNRLEAAKVVLPNLAENENLAERFAREIRLHASLDHPNIAAIRTAFQDGNRLIMVMELVEGETLASRLLHNNLALTDGLRCVDQILTALDYFHQRNVVHRDIKSANIMLTADGQVKVMDFGVAKEGTDQALTKTGFTVGSLHYMSPEQIKAGTVDARSDIYSLGIVMYEILTRKRPFEGESEYALASAHLETTPQPPAELAPDVPAGLSDVVMMALAKEPAKRFQTARAFQNALRAVSPALAGAPEQTPASDSATPVATAPPPPDAAAPPPPPPMGGSGKPGSGMRLVYMLAGALAVIVVAALAVTQIPKWRSARAEPETEQAVEMPSAATSDALPGAEPDEPAAPDPDAVAGQVAEPPVAPAGDDTPRQAVAQTPPSTPPAAVSEPPAQSTASAKPSPGPPARAAEAEMPPIERTTGFLDAQAAAKEQREAEAALHAALEELDERQVLMGARIAAVQSALGQLQQEQSRMGVSLRGDMASARQLLQTRMSQAKSALDASDVERAKEYLDQAEHALRKLEGFLNL